MSRYYQVLRKDNTVYTSDQREKVEDRIHSDWPKAMKQIPLVRKKALENALRRKAGPLTDDMIEFNLQVIGEEAVQYVNPDGKVVATITYKDT